MRYLAALTALGLLASTAAFAQNSTDQSSQGQSSQNTNQATGATSGQALSQPFVRRIQLRLKQQGEYDGKVTGTYDQETANAVKEFTAPTRLTINRESRGSPIRTTASSPAAMRSVS
jgi:peptidoglycan hydrolase-like protein with peptidoglycan-binding domain